MPLCSSAAHLQSEAADLSIYLSYCLQNAAGTSLIEGEAFSFFDADLNISTRLNNTKLKQF